MVVTCVCDLSVSELIDTYIDDNAILSINVSSAARTELLAIATSRTTQTVITCDVFETVAAEIERLLARDSFRRFQGAMGADANNVVTEINRNTPFELDRRGIPQRAPWMDVV